MENINENLETSLSQNKMIAAYLNQGKRITQWEALFMFGCSRLASRIHDLREKGMNIQKETIILPQNGKRVAQYYIAQEKEK